MRTIKFRAWIRETKERVNNFENDYAISELKNDFFIVEQFTGLTDKNGVEVWEGDIISFEDDPNGFVKWNEDFSCFTTWDDKKVTEDELYDWYILRKEDSDSYIIHGNIHENPELLAVPTAVL